MGVSSADRVGTRRSTRNPGAECAYRLGVDRAKIGGLRIHLHPFGQPNDVRLPRSNLGTPEQWLVEIEELYYVWYG